MTQVRISEATGSAGTLTGARQLITVITPGWGSSGYYSAEVLQQAVKDKVWPAGTRMYADHPTYTEQAERPARSIRDIAAHLTQDAVWNEREQAVQAEARVLPAWRETLKELKDVIGTSIYTLTEAEIGEAEGQHGQLVVRMIPDPLNSVDYVTSPGRGGRITTVLESAREVTHNDLRTQLSDALRSSYEADGHYVWVEDSNEEVVWFTLERVDSAPALYQQSYTVAEGQVTFEDSPVEVTRVVSFVPVEQESPSTPAGDQPTQEGTTMATIDDAELVQLQESASRATALQAERDEIAAERDRLVQEAAESALNERVRSAESAVTTAFGDDVPAFYLESARRAARAEDFNQEAFEAQVNEAAAARESSAGAGRPSGVGETRSVESSSASSPVTRTAEDFISALEGR